MKISNILVNEDDIFKYLYTSNPLHDSNKISITNNYIDYLMEIITEGQYPLLKEYANHAPSSCKRLHDDNVLGVEYVWFLIRTSYQALCDEYLDN